MAEPVGKQGLYDPCFEHDGCGIGAIASLTGQASHSLVKQALAMLINLRHRGATGYDPHTGDGAGIILQKPHALLEAAAAKLGIKLPGSPDYAVGTVFLPPAAGLNTAFLAAFAAQAARVGLEWLGVRPVPVISSHLGEAAAAVEPLIVQVFLGRGSAKDELSFARALYLARRLFEREAAALAPSPAPRPHVTSLSSRTLVYKGMLLPEQLGKYFADLSDPSLVSALAAVHSRFSTNTFPAWHLAHPFRYLCHNGEINTIRGNMNWLRARQKSLAAELFGPFAEEVLPLIGTGLSDSACLDEAVELLMLGGRSMPEAMLLLMPEAWQKSPWLSERVRAFYEHNATLMEPWDGPAAVCFTDGQVLGATLDRNGLRPCRYTVTHSGLVILASETGVLPVAPADIKSLGKLRPGEMLLIDTATGQLHESRELKEAAAARFDYQAWTQANVTPLANLPSAPTLDSCDYGHGLGRLQTAFAYSREELTLQLEPMGLTGEEAVNSMGDDTPLAVLSHAPRPLFDYFKQQFAQVTNPAIDSLREDMVMSLAMYLGAKASLIGPPARHRTLIRVEQPVLSDSELTQLSQVKKLRACTLSLLFPTASGIAGFAAALTALLHQAKKAVTGGAALLILSDRGVGDTHAALPSLLATAAVHHHLLSLGLRTQADLILETGEARSAHHIACLLGFGAAAVSPYLAFASLAAAAAGQKPPLAAATVQANFIKACTKGLNKILAKMGIATLQSYCGAQIFEAIGLATSLTSAYFPGTVSRLGGLSLEHLATETLERHQQAFDGERSPAELPPIGGYVHYRAQGEEHGWDPETISRLQHATQTTEAEAAEGRADMSTPATGAYAAYARAANAQSRHPFALRHLLDPVPARTPAPLAEVEPVTAIVKRFTTGAMSLGAISKESHEGLAVAMNRIGGKSNTGEGGEDPARFLQVPGVDSTNSAIKQVASGRFGVTIHYLVNADEIRIKIAQGAKPGEGGQLPGHKVDEAIARLRFSTPGVQLISPPPHHDIYSIEDLAQLIFDLKNANPRAKISVKLVAEAGIGPIAVGVVKAGANKILISGDGGGTGASPLSSIKHAGAPWEMGLAEVHQTLLLNRLRDRVRLETDGQLRTGRDVVIAGLLGADEFGFSTAPLIVQGCIMMRKCHLNTCPVGIATQDPELRARFTGKPEHVVNYFFFVAEEVRQLLALLGLRTFAELVGRTDLLRRAQHVGLPAKAEALDLSLLLYRPQLEGSGADQRTRRELSFNPEEYDESLVSQCRPALEEATPVVLFRKITNAQRSTGTLLASAVAQRYGAGGLADGSITLRFEGTAGQSFAAFLASGISAFLAGAANDYVGKGLAGGRIVIAPPRHAELTGETPMLIGNTTLYGATSGALFAAGGAGERFAVRNSGALAVVEAAGDHCCEYMTGGLVVVLGRVGQNFGAGMSGGVAYVLDSEGIFHLRCNTALIDLSRMPADVGAADAVLLRQLVQRHLLHTQSPKAQRLLANWEWHLTKFVKVTPKKAAQQVSELRPKTSVTTTRAHAREVSQHV